jgi:hypothetical protein
MTRDAMQYGKAAPDVMKNLFKVEQPARYFDGGSEHRCTRR